MAHAIQIVKIEIPPNLLSPSQTHMWKPHHHAWFYPHLLFLREQGIRSYQQNHLPRCPSPPIQIEIKGCQWIFQSNLNVKRYRMGLCHTNSIEIERKPRTTIWCLPRKTFKRPVKWPQVRVVHSPWKSPPCLFQALFFGMALSVPLRNRPWWHWILCYQRGACFLKVINSFMIIDEKMRERLRFPKSNQHCQLWQRKKSIFLKDMQRRNKKRTTRHVCR